MEERIVYITAHFLEGKADSSEKAELFSWLKRSDENVSAFLSYYQAWDLSKQLEFDPKTALKKMHHLLKERNLQNSLKKSPFHVKLYLRYAISVAASLLIIWGPYFFSTKNRSYDIRELAIQRERPFEKTGNIQLISVDGKKLVLEGKMVRVSYHDNIVEAGKRKLSVKVSTFHQLIVPEGHKGLLSLDDGTQIWVKAGSRLFYPTRFDKRKKREIYVEGEIYLAVAHRLDQAFIVKTKDLNVRVTGTKFDVSAYSEDKSHQVILVHGSVNVSRSCLKKDERRLFPGQMYSLSDNQYESVRNVDVSRYVSWVDDIYDCQDKSLEEVVRELERFYGKRVVCEDKVAMLTCSGKLDLQEDLPSLLRNVSEVLSLKYYVKNGIYYLSK